MNTNLDAAIVHAMNKKLVWAMRDSDAENICLECAQENKKSIILTSHEESPWTMADTGTCMSCGSTKDVFCESIIKIQRESELSPKDFFGNFPRIMGGSQALNRRELFSSKTQPVSKSRKCISWKKLLLLGLAILIVFVSITTAFAEYYRAKTLKGFEQIAPLREKTNKAMLKDYDNIKSSAVTLPLEKVFTKETMEQTFQSEKDALKEVEKALSPLHFYFWPEDSLVAFSYMSPIVANKLQMLHILWQYKFKQKGLINLPSADVNQSKIQ